MAMATRSVQSFPSISLASAHGGAPVEVALISQLGIGAGDRLVQDAGIRQAAHVDFIDALDEPSTRIGGMHLEHGDASSLYTFAVGPAGHPFHRHATPRTFTGISGSGGAQLRFSTASDDDVASNAVAFVAALRLVEIPPDCLFTVRFGGGTWHQFVPLRPTHPALFALSCHTNELGGALSMLEREQVEANAASIPALTTVLPSAVQLLLDRTDLGSVPTVALSLHAAPLSAAEQACAVTRDFVGRMRTRLGSLRSIGGFLGRLESKRVVRALRQQPPGSLLARAVAQDIAHDDCVEVRLPADAVGSLSATEVLSRVLEGFLDNPPAGVGRLMALRNLAVAPLKLRTSPLGCPVSSLLSTDRCSLFAGRFPVLDQALDPSGKGAQVLLGADDRHLIFRSCVAVFIDPDGSARVSLGTRVQTRNAFGRFYMAAIDAVHRRYVGPTMLRMAVDHAVAPELSPGSQLDRRVAPAVLH
jgi:hypothetical protein